MKHNENVDGEHGWQHFRSESARGIVQADGGSLRGDFDSGGALVAYCWRRVRNHYRCDVEL